MGGLAGLFAVWVFVRGVILDPIWQAQAEVANLLADQGALQAKVQMEPLYKRQWTQLRAKTFNGEPNAAAGQLDILMKKLMQDAGLVNLSVNVGRPREEKKTWPGLYIIPYTVVQAGGTMEAFTRFLHAFYQQPYAMQILSFNLEQPPLARANPLHISSLMIEAVVLSSDGMPPSLTSQPAGQTAEQAKPWRPAEDSLDHYAVIWNKKFMEPYTEPTTIVAAPPPVAPEPAVAPVLISPSGGTVTAPMDVRITCNTQGATIRYTTDGSMPTATAGNIYDTNTPIHVAGPLTIKAIAFQEGLKDSPLAMATFAAPPAPPLKLIGLWTYGSVSEAVFLNEQSKERIYVREGETFDGGKLLLVLPEAAVAEMPDGPRFVYWLGKPVKEKEQLDPARQPDIAAAVEILVEPH
jgi:hypothetical protein